MTTVEPQVPHRFGPYVIVRMLDGGGQGRVDLALMGKAGRDRVCVIKRMLPELVGEDARARFEHELRVTRRLSHAAVVQTLAVDEIEGEPCLVQEYVEGHSLAFVMSVCGTRRQPIPVPLAAHVVREVLRALDYVHSFENLGLVHRDISPANIQLSFTGDVKLLDFGVAKSDVQGFETATGLLVGRPAFVAPEVHAGLKADRRADIYAAGVVLWSLLARRFVGDVRDANGNLPAPSTLNAAVPVSLDAIVARALVARPEERYQDAGSFSEALAAAVPESFDGPAAVRDLLGALFDIEAERRMRAVDLGAARSLLGDGKAPEQPKRGAATTRRLAAFAVVALVAGAVGAAYSRLGTDAPAQPRAEVRAVRPSIMRERSALRVQALPAPAPSVVVDTTPAPAAPVIRTAEKPRAASPGRAMELTDLAEKRLGEEKFDDAVKLSRAAIRAGAGADARVILARALLETGRRSEAERELVAATKAEPGNTAAEKFLRDLRAGGEERR